MLTTRTGGWRHLCDSTKHGATARRNRIKFGATARRNRIKFGATARRDRSAPRTAPSTTRPADALNSATGGMSASAAPKGLRAFREGTIVPLLSGNLDPRQLQRFLNGKCGRSEASGGAWCGHKGEQRPELSVRAGNGSNVFICARVDCMLPMKATQAVSYITEIGGNEQGRPPDASCRPCSRWATCQHQLSSTRVTKL